MNARTFTRAELAAYGVPPDTPEDVEWSETVLADEHVGMSKYSQERRCVFRADDDRTYAVTYEAQLDAGHYEVGPPPENHGWYGDTVEAVEVEQRPVIVARWEPVTDDPAVSWARPGALDSLAAVWEESGARTSIARQAATEWIVQHAYEVAQLYDEYLDSVEGTSTGDALSEPPPTSRLSAEKYRLEQRPNAQPRADHIEHKTVWQVPGTGHTHWGMGLHHRVRRVRLREPVPLTHPRGRAVRLQHTPRHVPTGHLTPNHPPRRRCPQAAADRPRPSH